MDNIDGRDSPNGRDSPDFDGRESPDFSLPRSSPTLSRAGSSLSEAFERSDSILSVTSTTRLIPSPGDI